LSYGRNDSIDVPEGRQASVSVRQQPAEILPPFYPRTIARPAANVKSNWVGVPHIGCRRENVV